MVTWQEEAGKQIKFQISVSEQALNIYTLVTVVITNNHNQDNLKTF